MPFVIQIVAAVGLVGYLSFKNGEKVVGVLADRVIVRTNAEVRRYLDAYLSIPHKISQINADAIRLGLLDVKDRNTIAKYFWYQMQSYDLSYISLNLNTGEQVGAGRYDGKTVVIDDVVPPSPDRPNNTTTYLTDQQGNRTRIIATGPWDTFSQPNYTAPIKAGKPIWIPITPYYAPEYPPYIAASAGQPVYDQNQKLIGTIGAEIHLSKLSDYLRNIDIGEGGQIFIIERDGSLIANSAIEQPFFVKDQTIHRLKATESPNPIVKGIAQQLSRQFQGFQAIQATKKLNIRLDNTTYYTRVIPWRDRYGLSWLVVMSIPERQFMAQIYANTQITVFLCFVALTGAITIGFFTTRWINRPLRILTAASQSMVITNMIENESFLAQSPQTTENLARRSSDPSPSDGALVLARIEDSRIEEISVLARSFQHMSQRLRESFMTLEKTNEELEARVDARTLELQTTLQELKQTQVQMLQSEKMSSLGQLVAGIAHEINNPVAFIYGNLKHVDNYTNDLLEFIQLYQAHYPQPGSEIQAMAETIEFDFIQEDLPKILASMRIGAERIREIVLSLRTFSRLDESDLKLVNLSEGIESTLLILDHRLKENPKRPEIQVLKTYEDVGLVECYAGPLNQVFMNLLANAIDAVEEKNIGRTYQEIQANPNQIKITIAAIEPNWVQISVADNGFGIPDSVQDRILDPFFTTKEVGKGSGMGLAISYQIITEKHGGELAYTTEPGAGTCFTIAIPLRQSSGKKSFAAAATEDN